jgi:hypothetical protein
MPKITSDTPIEDLVQKFPEAVGFLTRRGIRCIRCGEPLWCTIGELLVEEKTPDPQKTIEELIEFLESLNN